MAIRSSIIFLRICSFWERDLWVTYRRLVEQNGLKKIVLWCQCLLWQDDLDRSFYRRSTVLGTILLRPIYSVRGLLYRLYWSSLSMCLQWSSDTFHNRASFPYQISLHTIRLFQDSNVQVLAWGRFAKILDRHLHFYSNSTLDVWDCPEKCLWKCLRWKDSANLQLYYRIPSVLRKLFLRWSNRRLFHVSFPERNLPHTCLC